MNTPSSSTCRSRFPGLFSWLIDRAFITGMGPRTWRRVLGHARTCASCRHKLDRLGYVDEWLWSGSPLPSAWTDRIGDQVQARVVRPRVRTWRTWAAGAGVLATAAATLVLVLVRSDDQPGARLDGRGSLEFRARGAGERLVYAWAPGQRKPGVRLFCIDVVGAQARVAHAMHATEPGLTPQPLRCILGAELQLAYSTPDLHGLSMVVFSRDSSGRTYWYAPRSSEETSIPLLRDRMDEPLDWTTRLEVGHSRGVYELEVRFFDHPVPAEAAARGVVPPIYELRARMDITEPAAP